MSIRYLANSALGASITYSYPEVPYRFTTIFNTIHTSIDDIYFRPK